MSTVSENIYNEFKTISILPKEKEAALFSYCKEKLGLLEQLHFDYKEKQDRSVSRLDENDKKNLAKAVSGFANSGGGVLIWGIEDKTLNPKPISEIVEFIRKIQLLAVSTTEPVVANIESGVVSEDGNNGYGFIYIPESDLVPHRIILNIPEIRNHYYIRTAESFTIAPHVLLEDMFGRRPKPKLSLSTKFLKPRTGSTIPKGVIQIGIKNSGREAAKSPYLSISINQPFIIYYYGIDGNGSWGLNPLPKAQEDPSYRYGSGSNVVIHSGIDYPVTAVEYQVNISESYEGKPDLIINFQIGAEGIQLIEGKTIITAQSMFHQVVK